MAEKDKVTTMVLNVDLQCSKCYKKVKKLLCKFPEIRDQTYDEKANKVTIKVVCCSPEKIRDKLCRRGGGSIKSIEIKDGVLKPVTTMVLNVVVDLQCLKCYKKVKKLLCKFPEIRDQEYDEKANKVTIKVVSWLPEKIRDKLCSKGSGYIKSIEIKKPDEKKPSQPTQPKTQPQTQPPLQPKPKPKPPKEKKEEKKKDEDKKDEDVKPPRKKPAWPPLPAWPPPPAWPPAWPPLPSPPPAEPPKPPPPARPPKPPPPPPPPRPAWPPPPWPPAWPPLPAPPPAEPVTPNGGKGDKNGIYDQPLGDLPYLPLAPPPAEPPKPPLPAPPPAEPVTPNGGKGDKNGIHDQPRGDLPYPPLGPPVIEVWCSEGSSHSGMPGNPCYGGGAVQYVGYYGRPIYDSWGGGWCDYFSEENQQSCSLM